jgi:hypothetical protein
MPEREGQNNFELFLEMNQSFKKKVLVVGDGLRNDKKKVCG